MVGIALFLMIATASKKLQANDDIAHFHLEREIFAKKIHSELQTVTNNLSSPFSFVTLLLLSGNLPAFINNFQLDKK